MILLYLNSRCQIFQQLASELRTTQQYWIPTTAVRTNRGTPSAIAFRQNINIFVLDNTQLKQSIVDIFPTLVQWNRSQSWNIGHPSSNKLPISSFIVHGILLIKMMLQLMLKIFMLLFYLALFIITISHHLWEHLHSVSSLISWKAS